MNEINGLTRSKMTCFFSLKATYFTVSDRMELNLSNSYMAMITTGIESGESLYYSSNNGSSLAQSFRIPEDVTTLSFDVNMISEEPMEWIGSRYDDAFQVI